MLSKTNSPCRASSARLINYNYSQNGYYFVTLCTQDKKYYFGDIINDQMQLSEIGMIAKQQWLSIPEHYKENVTLDIFAIMPNHLHGIIIIYNDQYNIQKNSLSKIIQQYKAPAFQWQRSFYDHIIRNEISCQKIREYIQNNPLKWSLDKHNLKNKMH
jgi:putative transposase